MGMLWKRSSGDEGYWLGSYEAYKQKAIAKFLGPNDVFYDIGAYAGFYTLIACKKGAKAYAFEPDANNVKLLQDHIRVNKCRAITFNFAVSDKDGIERFHTHESPTSRYLSDDGEEEIKCRSIDSLVQDMDPPTVIKIDVEGAQRKILIGARETIRKYKPVFILEAEEKDFKDLLLDYSYSEIHENEYVCTPN